MVFRALIGRLPDEVEPGSSRGCSRNNGRRSRRARTMPRRLLAVGERSADEALDRVDLAALTMVASAVMNFDEFVVMR